MQPERFASRTAAVMRRFGVTEARRPGWDAWRAGVEAAAQAIAQEVRPGRVILVRGASGSGKSLVMGEVRRALRVWVDVEAQHLGDWPVIDHLHWMELEAALELLGRFGLGEVYTYLSPATQLSTGQRFRLRLAMAAGRLATRGVGTILADEFATQLDPVGAAVVARNVRKVVDESQLCVIAATCHDDVTKAIRPDVVVSCDFGQYEMTRRGAA